MHQTMEPFSFLWCMSNVQVDIFCSFLDESYSTEELTFFLYCRQTLMYEVGLHTDPHGHTHTHANVVYVFCRLVVRHLR